MDKQMDINEVVARALTDEEFANELRSKAQQVVKKVMDSPEWVEYMAYFNTSPETLARMKAGDFGDKEMMGPTWTVTTTATTTTSTCTVTTVTTTTTTW